ncbi:hypothetical protein DVK02_00905 [Halobellus sp. Atlit-31R]|nr:hypothetical protein DVK02_00905 [Halobellus sp. Atlit-31R]
MTTEEHASDVYSEARPTILYLATDPDLELLLEPDTGSPAPRVVVEVDPVRALDRIGADGIDCVVTDNRVYADDDGRPFVAAVAETAPETPVVVYASSGPASNETRLLGAGAAAFFWQTPNPTERRRICEEIVELARQSKPAPSNRASREDLELFVQISDDAFALHDFVTGRDVAYDGLSELIPADKSKFTIDDAFERIYEGDLPRVLEKNDAIFAKEPWAFDSMTDDVGRFSEAVRVRKDDGSIAHCLMRGIAVFDDEQLVKMYNSLTDVTCDVESDWQSQSHQMLLESDSDLIAAKEACQSLVDGTDCTAAWVTRHPISDHEAVEEVIAAAGSHTAFVGDADGDAAVERLNQRIVSDKKWSSDSVSVDSLSGLDEPLVYAEDTTGSESGVLVATPIVRQGVFYGVLTVVQPNYVTDTFERLLVTFAASLAYRSEVGAQRRALGTDALTEVRVRIDEDHFLMEFYEQYPGDDDTELQVRKLEGVEDGNTQYLVSCRSTDADGETVASAVSAIDAIDDVSRITTEETGATLIATVGEQTLDSILTPHASVVRQLRVTREAVSVTIDTPPRTDVRRIVRAVRETYPKTAFESRQKRTTDFVGAVRGGLLTDKQEEALRVATQIGFFDRPQRATAGDVAKVLDISRSTALHHIRNAECRVFSRISGILSDSVQG